MFEKQKFFKDNFSKFWAIGVLFFAIHLLIEWPIMVHFNENAAVFCKWDCNWYKSIVVEGYQTVPSFSNGWANFAFFPLVPILARGIYLLYDCSPDLALIFVSEYMFLLSIVAFIFFTHSVFENISPSVAASAIVFMPFTVHASAGYTEPAFCLFVMLTFLTFHQKKYVASAISGALLSAARPVGILIIPALALPQVFRFFKLPFKEKLSFSCCLLFMPLGLVLFMLYLYYHIGDALAFSHVQIAWKQSSCYFKPFCVLWSGLKSPYYAASFGAAMTACFGLYVAFFLFLKKKNDLAIFLLLCILIPLMFRIASLMRFIFWNPAFLLVVCYFLNKYRRYLYIILPIMAALMMQLYFYFILGESSWPV